MLAASLTGCARGALEAPRPAPAKAVCEDRIVAVERATQEVADAPLLASLERLAAEVSEGGDAPPRCRASGRAGVQELLRRWEQFSQTELNDDTRALLLRAHALRVGPFAAEPELVRDLEAYARFATAVGDASAGGALESRLATYEIAVAQYERALEGGLEAMDPEAAARARDEQLRVRLVMLGSTESEFSIELSWYPSLARCAARADSCLEGRLEFAPPDLEDTPLSELQRACVEELLRRESYTPARVQLRVVLSLVGALQRRHRFEDAQALLDRLPRIPDALGYDRRLLLDRVATLIALRERASGAGRVALDERLQARISEVSPSGAWLEELVHTVRVALAVARINAARDSARALTQRDHERLLTLHDELYATQPELARALIERAIVGYDEAGASAWVSSAAGRLLARHDARGVALELLWIISAAYERQLELTRAVEVTERFLERASEGDPRIAEARVRLVRFALLRGDSVEALYRRYRELFGGLARGGADNQRFLAAAAFRVLARARPRTESESLALEAALAEYLKRHGAHAGAARRAIVHVELAARMMRRSCPLALVSGLCVEPSAAGTLTLPKARRPSLRRAALRHARAAEKLFASGSGRGALAEPELLDPVALREQELADARVTLELLRGDLEAEAHLSVMPPASYEPAKTREWLDARTAALDAMLESYGTVAPALDALENRRTPGWYAATVAARSAQSYEAGSSLFSKTSEGLRRRLATRSARARAVERAAIEQLLARLEELGREHRRAALYEYNACLERVAAWGHDPGGLVARCQAGIQRLTGRRRGAPAMHQPARRGVLLSGPTLPRSRAGTPP